MKLNNKGFTLVEIVIIVMLSMLMFSMLPGHSHYGGEARARDTGRVADLGNIAAALTSYYNKNGQFPGIGNTGANANFASNCLDDTGVNPIDEVGQKIAVYFEMNRVPKDPQKNANTYLCDGNVKGRYWYAPLTKDGIANNAYILCADLETYQKANTDVGAGAADDIVTGITVDNSAMALQTQTDGTYAILAAKVGAFDNSAEAAQAERSQYCILRP